MHPTRPSRLADGTARHGGAPNAGPLRPAPTPMTLRLPHLRNLAVLVTAFAAAALALALVNRSHAPSTPSSSDLANAGVARTTDQQIATLQRALRARPGDPSATA